MTESIITSIDAKTLLLLFGTCDQNVRKLRSAFQVDITHRDGKIRISGDDAAVVSATKAVEQLRSLVNQQGRLSEEDVESVLPASGRATSANGKPAVTRLSNGREVRPRTEGQASYIQAIAKNDLTFAVGPAGTGKTYLAVAMAVRALRDEEIRKIVLVRPAVEAGESLGFLPGDLQAKINPYLRPLLDALYEMMDYDQIKRYMEKDLIEVIPLAYMRGRTLNEAFIILDEAQNTTVAQMKMFLTRMGSGSKIVVAGDETQVDLPAHTRSGLTDALKRLKKIKGVAEARLTGKDIVRHRLVMQIVQAYDEGPKK